jgi:hypothetical protein
MAITNIDDKNSSQFVFVHFNVKIDNNVGMLIENSINELIDDLKAQSLKYFDEIIVHNWNAVLFSREFDGNSQILHYIVIDAPNMIGDKGNLNRKMEIFVDGVVKLFISKYITRV